MKTTLRFNSAKDKRRFLRWRSFFALGVLIGLGLTLYWVDQWTELSYTQDTEFYEPYRTPGECCESLDDLEENYRQVREPILQRYLIAGITIALLSYLGNEIIKKKIPISKSKTLS